MTTLRVNKGELIAILTKNRNNHRASFEVAQEVYRETVIAELDKMLSDARDGSKIRRHVNLAAPEDHTAEYDRLIGLLKLTTDQSVDLSLNEYQNYVEDNWLWSKRVNALNENYGARNISPMFVGEDAKMPLSF